MGGGGVQKVQKLVYVVYGWHQMSVSDVGFGNGRPKGHVGAGAGDARGRPGLKLDNPRNFYSSNKNKKFY